MFSIVYNRSQFNHNCNGGDQMGKSYPVSARVSENIKQYLDELVEKGIAINTSEALKLCIRYAKQKKMEDEI
jgi:hypothetical protein